jgi:hypothetical protein
MRTEFLLENLKERGHTEDLSIDGRIILRVECTLGIYGGKVWTGWKSQCRDHWRAVVDTVLNIRVPQKAGGIS